MSQEVSTELLKFVIGVILAIGMPMVYKLIERLADKAGAWLDAKLGAENAAEVQRCVSNAVHYVEQVYATRDGEEKKRQAEQRVQLLLKQRGLDVDVEALSTFIEATLQREINALKSQ